MFAFIIILMTNYFIIEITSPYLKCNNNLLTHLIQAYLYSIILIYFHLLTIIIYK
jgi:hypothetical protein